MATKYKHADFLKNIPGIPNHWFVYRDDMFGKNMMFANLKTNKDLSISPTYQKGDSEYDKGNNQYVHVNYGGEGIGVFYNVSQALTFARKYMRDN